MLKSENTLWRIVLPDIKKSNTIVVTKKDGQKILNTTDKNVHTC